MTTFAWILLGLAAIAAFLVSLRYTLRAISQANRRGYRIGTVISSILSLPATFGLVIIGIAIYSLTLPG